LLRLPNKFGIPKIWDRPRTDVLLKFGDFPCIMTVDNRLAWFGEEITVNSKSRFLTFLCIFITVAVLVWPAAAQEPPRQPPGPPTGRPDYVPGEILVKFKPRVSTFGAQNALRAEGLQTLEVSPHGGVMRVQVAPGREDKAIAALLAREDVEIASYNHIFEASIEPDDPYYSNQWALPKIEAPAAWDMTTGNSNVVVAIVDSGLDTSHVEFTGRIVDPRDEIDGDYTPQDTCGHGTHVTGISAAKGNNAVGVAGVAWDVRILPVRVLTWNGYTCSGGEYDIRDGINWAVSHGAKVINLSLGALPDPGYTCEQVFPIMSSAIADAYNAGVLVVAATGNNAASRLACPALQSQTMAVGATTSSDERASYSNYGAGLDVVAPGSSIYSTIPGGYGYMSGTSMATPHVSGLAALLWSFAPDLTHNQVRDIIQSTTDDLGTSGWDDYFGYGRINARRALASISLRTSPPQTFFLLDADSGPFPASNAVQVTTASPNVMTWTATISPAVPWLSVAPPASGTVSAATSPPAEFTLVATRPIAYPYGTYTATAVVTGSTLSGGQVGPVTTAVRLNYLADLYQYIFPIIYKNYTW